MGEFLDFNCLYIGMGLVVCGVEALVPACFSTKSTLQAIISESFLKSTYVHVRGMQRFKLSYLFT